MKFRLLWLASTPASLLCRCTGGMAAHGKSRRRRKGGHFKGLSMAQWVRSGRPSNQNVICRGISIVEKRPWFLGVDWKHRVVMLQAADGSTIHAKFTNGAIPTSKKVRLRPSAAALRDRITSSLAHREKLQQRRRGRLRREPHDNAPNPTRFSSGEAFITKDHNLPNEGGPAST